MLFQCAILCFAIAIDPMSTYIFTYNMSVCRCISIHDTFSIRECNLLYVPVSFHHQKPMFHFDLLLPSLAAASHILCDMNEIFSVWLNLNCVRVCLYSAVFASTQFGIYTPVQLCLCVWCNFLVKMHCCRLSFSLAVLSPFFVCFRCTCGFSFREKCAVCDGIATKLCSQSHERGKLTLPSRVLTVLRDFLCCKTISFFLFPDRTNKKRLNWNGSETKRRNDRSHYYSLSNLIELLWYITFRFAQKNSENDKLRSDSARNVLSDAG